MTWIRSDIQDGFSLRRGWRGRYLTVYLHKYSGKVEATERLHGHPWKLAVSILLWGYMVEVIHAHNKSNKYGIHTRGYKLLRGYSGTSTEASYTLNNLAMPIFWLVYMPLRLIRFYTRNHEHRIKEAKGYTLFIGLIRTQRPIPRAAEVRVKEGYAHYTELISL